MNDLIFEHNKNWSEPVTSVFVRLSHFNDAANGTRVTASCQDDLSVVFFKGLGRMFYIVSPSDSNYDNVTQVPKFFSQSWPYFLLFMLLENLLLWLDRKPTYRLNDTLTSLSHGLIQESGRLIFRGAESYLYIWLHENFCLVQLPWNQPSTWYLAAIGVDFCYYWLHRASHEIHILWAQHQVHHSSEEFNLTVGLRQSIFQGWCGFLFYLPLALIVPPVQFTTHQQFNLLFQFWIHTKVVSTLGPLEYIFNTPNHHRVHHGSNIYCLDKNYGGVLIIWDRIFGTFAEEQKSEEIIYGLVYNQPSFNPMHLQTFYTAYVADRFKVMVGWRNKLATVFYGPSWQPGRPRLGVEEDKIKVLPREKYNVNLPLWCNAYLFIHFCVVVYGFQELAARYTGTNPLSLLAFVLYIIASLTTIGMLFDNHPQACILELVRCMLLVTVLQRVEFPDLDKSTLVGIEVFFLMSGLFWLLQSAKILQIGTKSKSG